MARKRKNGTKSPPEPLVIHPDAAGIDIGATEIFVAVSTDRDGGDTSQWAPALFENIKPIEPPHDQPDYFFDKDMADHAIARIQMLHAVAPDKPWVTYYAPGTAHAPHHAPKDWIAKYKGQFDMGWDKMREATLARQKALGIVPQDTQLTPRPKEIPAWDSLDADHKKVYAHMMEVYAAALSYCDTQMGRIVDAIDENGRDRQHPRHLHSG